MKQWLSSKEFALQNNIVKKSLEKACFRAKQRGKEFCTLKGKILPFIYINGIGRGGKVLRIWSEPFNSEAEAEDFIHSYRVENLAMVAKQSKRCRACGCNACAQHDKNKDVSPLAQHDKRRNQHDGVEAMNKNVLPCPQYDKNKASESSLLATASVAKSVDFANNECNNEIAINNNSFNDKVIDVSATQDSPMAQHDRVKAEHDKGSVRNNTIIETSGARLQNDNKVENDKVKDSSATQDWATHYSALLRHNTSGVIQHDLLAGHDKVSGINSRVAGHYKTESNNNIAEKAKYETQTHNTINNIAQNDKVKDSNNTQSKEIESNIASINIAMGGVVDSNIGVCNNEIDTYSKIASNDKVVKHQLIESNNTIEQVKQNIASATQDSATQDSDRVENSKVIDVSLVSQEEHDKVADSKESNNYQALSKFDLSDRKSQLKALAKRQTVKEWESLKKKGVSAKDYIALVNANIDNAYTLKLSENKLYAWQRAYKKQGIDGLLDNRGIAKTNTSKIKELGLESLVDSIIEAQSSRINIANVHEMLHLHLHIQGIHDYIDYKLKDSEYISYSTLERYIKEWKKANRLKTTLIYKGNDAAVGNYKASLGKSNYNVTSINQVVEIDASPLDKIFDAKSLADGLDIDISHIKSWQKRYVLFSLVDTYSRVASFHISDSENSLGIARAVAKYILKYGKPKVIKGDNGKAFLSKYTKEVMQNLDIEYKNVEAYSGWLKPYVENTFRTIQDRVISWGKGYIGHNVRERQAIEFFFSKKERRLKRGAKTNLKELDSFLSMLSVIDKYATLSMNRYIDDLGCSPCEAYNAKANEAIAMNEYELVMKLSPSLIKTVNKKGIMHGGVWYGCIEAFNYDKVFVRANINNTKELFIYDKKGNFIEIAHCVDSIKGVSAEVAKRAEQITFKRIKVAQKDIDNNRSAQQNNLDLLITKAEQDAPKVKTPKTPPINNINIVAAKLRREAQMQKAVGDDILEQIENEQIIEQKKKDLSFFAAVIKNKKACSKIHQ